MTALSITAATVKSQTGGVIENGTAGVSVTAGQAVYLDETTTGEYQLADANSGTAAARKARGIALHAAGAHQPLAIHKSGPLNLGATLTAGVAYYLSSAAAGSIVPVADLTTGDYPCLLGMAASASIINVDIQSPGAAL